MNKRTSRACVFIDSSNPLMPSTVINGAQPFIKPSFPPAIKPHDLLKRSRDGSLSKPPNAFIIYRKWFIETARSEGYFLPMTVISSMASQSWEQEPSEVKAAYKRIGKEAFNLRNEMLPKSGRRRKREKWNIVTFDDEEVKLRPELIKSTSNPPCNLNQFPLSPQSLSTESTPTISPLTSPVIAPSSPDSEFAQFMIPSPMRSTFDKTFMDKADELNHWFPSSESSSISSPENNEQYLLDLESSDSSSSFELFVESPIMDLVQPQQEGSSSYLNNMFHEFSSFDIPSQNFLNTESSNGDFYFM
ncbi:hypothetical protein C1645_771421 [Glomus cerebriforme]|uniref:HMG box domain-containing protein n=1 Tax=Glomus cerebriforme TaxID=658196 RepID=A0A397T411_9GLOM|nr:hypothetical protein C1645_771421 [Glomus cerebriforme]